MPHGTTKIQPTETTAEQDAINIGMLTPRQRLFVQHLIADKEFNLNEAARKAGFKHPCVDAARMLRLPKVIQVLGKELQRRCDRLEITADRVLKELACIGFSNPKNFLRSDGSLIPIQELPNDVAVCIKELTINEKTDEENGTTRKVVNVKLWDKLDALTMLAKHVGLLKDVAPQLNIIAINWDEMVKGQEQVVDFIEQRIEQEKNGITEVVDAT